MDENKNRILKWGAWALIALTIFISVEILAVLKNLPDKNPAYNSISVIGEGEIVTVPDVATFSFTVSADAKTVSEAQTAVTTKMDAILAALNDAGVEEKDIDTQGYNVYPKYSYTQAPCSVTNCPPSRQVLEGYTASHNVTVKVRKTDDAGKMIGIVGDKGATDISGVSFTQDDPNKAMLDARAKAIADAREKAEVLADQLDVHLVRLISYYDNQQGYPMPYATDVAYGGVAMEKAQSNPTIPIGEQKTKVQVTLVYEIR